MKIQPRERRRSEPCSPSCQRERSLHVISRLTSRDMALDLILRRLASPHADSQPHRDSLDPGLSIRLRRRDPLTPRRRVRSSTFEQIRRFEERHRAH